MKKTLLLTVLAIFIASAAMAQAPVKPFTIYAGGGLTMPMGPDYFKDNTKMGFHGFAQLGFDVIPKGQAVINLEYHMIGADWDNAKYGTDYTDGGDVSIIMVGGDFKFNFGLPAAPIKPFVFGGVGLAISSQSDITSTSMGTLPAGDSQNDMYFQFGAGVHFNQFFAKARYVNIMTEGESSSMIPISVGVSF